MSRMQIIVGGETLFDEVVDGWMLPPKPDQIPPAIRAQLDPNAKPAPWMKAFMLAAIGKAAQRALQDPRMQPIDVHLDARATGWTLTVDMPAPADHGDIEPADH